MKFPKDQKFSNVKPEIRKKMPDFGKKKYNLLETANM